MLLRLRGVQARPGVALSRERSGALSSQGMKHASAQVVFLALALGLPAVALAQGKGYEMTPTGEWKAQPPAPAGSDEALMQELRSLIAAGKNSEAITRSTAWIEGADRKKNPYMPEALLLRGNARLAEMDEYEALRDYEQIVKDYPGCEQFVPALERELDVAVLYLNGLRKKSWIFRIDSGRPTAEEIILRINERLPGSRLGERALLLLADYYYREHRLRMAAETYDVFLSIFPNSEKRSLAMQRRTYANIAQFKGTHYDPTKLIDSQYQIQRYRREFPAQSEKAGMSDALAARIEESLAAQMLGSARWYLTREDGVSARFTLNRLVKRYPLSGAAREALQILDERGWGPSPAEEKPPSPGADVTPPTPAIAPATGAEPEKKP